MIIHLAALCGGIGANQANGARFFYDNAIMGIQMIEQARQFGIEKFVQVGTVCSYPGNTPVPFREGNFGTVIPKRPTRLMDWPRKCFWFKRKPIGITMVLMPFILLPANLYGPRDHFDLENSHVIPALIHKIYEAGKGGRPFIEVWGSGKASREFLYAGDAAEAIVLAAQKIQWP